MQSDKHPRHTDMFYAALHALAVTFFKHFLKPCISLDQIFLGNLKTNFSSFLFVIIILYHGAKKSHRNCSWQLQRRSRRYISFISALEKAQRWGCWTWWRTNTMSPQGRCLTLGVPNHLNPFLLKTMVTWGSPFWDFRKEIQKSVDVSEIGIKSSDDWYVCIILYLMVLRTNHGCQRYVDVDVWWYLDMFDI